MSNSIFMYSSSLVIVVCLTLNIDEEYIRNVNLLTEVLLISLGYRRDRMVDGFTTT